MLSKLPNTEAYTFAAMSARLKEQAELMTQQNTVLTLQEIVDCQRKRVGQNAPACA